ncbi:LIM zinc-binding domain-containing protein, partial [Meloidogyne graminicola]
MQNTKIELKEGISTFPMFEAVSEPLLYNSEFWNENLNIQQDEFNQFYGINNLPTILQQQNNYEKQNIEINNNNNNSLLFDLNSNLFSEQFSSYNINMINDNEQQFINNNNILQQQQQQLNLNIQSSQQNELLLIT